jgi:hypothetical protein
MDSQPHVSSQMDIHGFLAAVPKYASTAVIKNESELAASTTYRSRDRSALRALSGRLNTDRRELGTSLTQVGFF